MDDQFKPMPKAPKRSEGFKTPDQIAATDGQSSGSPLLNKPVDQEIETKPMGKKKNHRFKLWPPNKWTLGTIAIVLLIIAAGTYWYYKIHKTVTNSPIIVSTVKKPTTVASTLTGVQVSPSTNKLPITAVMIENSTDARPQSGLSQAGVVFEALAEGGVTRFVALYQSNSAQVSVGPVRSARPYFISWMLGFDAAYAHVGGSPEALSDISQWNVKDMNQFYNGSYYQRVSNRAAPHNVYTTMDSMYKLEQAKGYSSSNFTSIIRKLPKPLKTPTASSISISMSGPIYNVAYTYVPTSNTYNRNVGGAPAIDATTNKQLNPNVVVAIVVPESQGALDASGAYYSEYQTIGSGTAYIFQDGGVTVGQWSKTSNTAQITFANASGQPIGLNPGQTWITAVTSTSAVSY